ncbi:MAG: L,D-transpeptidase family protein [Verrucomicrobiales bacterium]
MTWFSCSLRTLLFASTSLLFVSCALDENGMPIPLFEPAVVPAPKPVAASPQSKYYSANHFIYVNEKLLPTLHPQNSSLEIALGAQRARLFRQDARGKTLIVETQISTGKEGYDTPTGHYKVLEKSMTKKSSLYGKWVDASSGDTVISNGDSREPPASGNAEFRGTPMPYWLRVTGSGVGMHVGFVPNYPASHGCIRVPVAVQPLIYEQVRVGTSVTITH